MHSHHTPQWSRVLYGTATTHLIVYMHSYAHQRTPHIFYAQPPHTSMVSCTLWHSYHTPHSLYAQLRTATHTYAHRIYFMHSYHTPQWPRVLYGTATTHLIVYMHSYAHRIYSMHSHHTPQWPRVFYLPPQPQSLQKPLLLYLTAHERICKGGRV